MENDSWIRDAVKASNDYERSNTDLKRRYILKNMQAFNYIASLVSVNQGTFGTGYPFYVLDSNLEGKIPVIHEQIRYNRELLNHAITTETPRWTCEECLTERHHEMPDLKKVCKPCPNMDKELKPRKVINRLPDMDMWMVCRDGQIGVAQEQLANLLEKYGIHTSDVDPIQTIKDMTEISENIKKGVMPKKFLPIDTHIVEYSEIQKIISKVPATLRKARDNKTIPYLPIHPTSYRKTWQYDDEAYNFILDFLASFTEFNIPSQLKRQLNDSRKAVIQEFTPIELYKFIIQTTKDGSRRRFEEPELIDNFIKRVEGWENIEQEKDQDRGDR